MTTSADTLLGTAEVRTAVADADRLVTLATTYHVTTPDEYSQAGQDLVNGIRVWSITETVVRTARG